MSSHYSVARNIGSKSYDGVYAPVNGALSTSQYPNTLPYHSYGILNGLRPTPPYFYPTQSPVNSNMYSNMRKQYLRAGGNKNSENNYSLETYHTTAYNINSSNKKIPISNAKFNKPLSSDLYLNKLKSNAIGKSSYKIGLPNNAPISTKNYCPPTSRSALRKTRSSGCVAPKKKGAIENTSLCNSRVYGIGSFVRQTY